MDVINSVIEELLKFSRTVLTVADGATEEKIRDFEGKYSLKLPNDYQTFLKRTNGLKLMGTVVYGIYDESVYMSLGRAFSVEHYEVENEMPKNLIPFSPDGGGNHYCFDSTRCDEKSCKVVFWQYNRSYSEENPPETVNDSFAAWVKEVLVDWTLEDYDYNGNRNV
ncbi:MAG: SMI1/KNR4 family protein [Bacteroidetes bacterium]|nr:SMI1/KNR4 family protein [Bacteroidota bacterium]